MKKRSKILPLFLSLLLAVCLFASAAADAPYAEITASGKTYQLTVTDCVMKTRNMYIVTVQGYNMAEDSDGGGFTVDEEHLPFFIAIGSDPEHTISWGGIQMSGDGSTPFCFFLEPDTEEPAVVIIRNKDDSWENGWIYDIAAQRLLTAQEWSSGETEPAAAEPAEEAAPQSEPEEGLRSRIPADVNAGDIVTFGYYPHTAEGSDLTPIEWIVLEKEDVKALLLSRYIIDRMPYNEENENVRWQTCSLRAALNDQFLHTAFTEAEAAAILPIAVANTQDQCDPTYRTDGGEDTVDQVFCLSYAEATRHFKKDADRQCTGTDYALSKNLFVFEGGSSWWLRTPGSSGKYAGLVNMTGRCTGNDVNSATGVRPAIWVDLSVFAAD